MKKFFSIILFLSVLNGLCFAETLTMTTYYPSPFGAYDQLRIVPRAADLSGACDIGTMYVNSTGELRYCTDQSGVGVWGYVPSVWKEVGTNVTLSDTAQMNSLKVGIGVANPSARLTVQGTGITSASTSLLVTDSGTNPLLFVDDAGNTGIGRNNPDNRLDVNGSLEIEVENADSKLRFQDPNDSWYSMGIDRSDAGKFKINYGANIGDLDQFIMTQAGNVEIGGTLKLKANGTNSGYLKVQYIGGANAGYYATYAP